MNNFMITASGLIITYAPVSDNLSYCLGGKCQVQDKAGVVGKADMWEKDALLV